MNRKILIVDDHDDFRETVKIFLKKQDLLLKIYEAPTAEVGLVIALRERPSIILLDIRLPGMHGIEAAAKIKQHLPDTHIILLTMLETDSLKEALKTEDVTAYIGKSELYDSLVPILEKILFAGEKK